MDKIFILKLAFRNLWLHKLRTLLTLTGIIIGISAVVFLISFSMGIERLVTSQITQGDAFLLIDVGSGNSQVVKLNNDLAAKIKQIAGVTQLETVANFGGKAKIKNESKDITVFGVSSGTYLDWAGKKIHDGRNLGPVQNGSQEALINTAYASLLTKSDPKTLIGQEITFDFILLQELSPTGETKVFPDPKMTIVGVIKDDATPSLYSNNVNFTFAEADIYSQFKVMVKDRLDVSTIRGKIEAYGLKTEYAGDTVAQVEQFFNVFKIVLGGFGLIALIVALLGMFNTLTISLLERIKEVALMQIFGMDKKDVRNLFLTEALTLGCIGGGLGIIWGIALGKMANYILNILAVKAGGDAVSVFYFSPILLVGTMAGAILIGFVTGIYPAIRAASVKPLDVLRYE